MSEEITAIERALVALGKPLPPSLVKKRDGPRIKGTDRYIQLDYVEWHVSADILNKHVPDWDFEIFSITETKQGDFAVAGTLTIAGVRRSNVGTSDKDGSNGPKVAASDCLKRCATLFGLGLDLYRDDEQNRWAVRRLEEAAQRIAEADKPAEAPAADDVAADQKTDEIVEAIKEEFGGVQLVGESDVEILGKELASVGRTLQGACEYYGVADPLALTTAQADELLSLVRKARERSAQAALGRA
jgi:hypothetical protein